MIKSNKLKASVALCAGLIFSLNFFLIPVSAQTIDSAEFTVRAVIPENQIDKSNSYFDLLMKPGQAQTLTVDVINNADKEMTVKVETYAASTNRNGLIEYQVKVDPDDTLKTPFDTIAKTAPEVTIAAKSTQKVNVLVSMPEKEFDGAILGGIVITKKNENNEASGVSINNQFSYVVGVKLSETDKIIAPDFKLKYIEPTLVNYRKAVSVGIHNPVALIIKNASVSANIYKKNDVAPLFSVNKSGIDMAPNSVYPMPIEWEGKDIDPGDYRLHLKLTYNGRVWEWDQDFNIAADIAGEINNGALDKPVQQSWWATWWWIPVMSILFILLLWFAFLLGRKRRDEEKGEPEE